MSRFGAKTYSRREVKSNLQFDQLLTDNKNKPSTAKVSVASVQRWGMASFTSIRKTQLEKQKAAAEGNSSKRKKVDTKVEPPDRGNSAFCEDPFSFDTEGRQDRVPTSSVGPISVPIVPGQKSSVQSKPNKFFKSREVRPLGVQNSPKIEPPPARDPAFRQPSDIKFNKLALETFPGTKKMDYKKSNQIVQENVNSHFIQQKPTDNIDLLCLQNPDPLEERSPTHSNNSPLPDYFGVPDSCDRTEEPFLPNSSDKLYSPADYPSELDNLLLSQKDSQDGEKCAPLVQTTTVPQTRTYTRSQKRAEGAKATGPAPNQYSAVSASGTLSHEPSSTSVPENDPFNPPLCMVPRTWSESVSLDTGVSDSSSFRLSQESKGTLSVPSLLDSQQFNTENEFTDHQRLKGHHSALKSRRIFNSPKLKKATYKHRPWQVEETEETEQSSQGSVNSTFADDFEVDEMGRGVVFDGHKLTLSKQVRPSRHSGETITSWTCQRKVKELYTVVHNVKQAYQCHESGETQEFNDDVEYLLEGIQQTSSLGTRCLSTLGWASKCMVPSFRIHVRAHGTMSSVYSALADAPKEPSLSLCVATLMFVLSQDRLTMDLEARSLSLMLQLLDTTESPADTSLSATQESQVPDSQSSIFSTCSSSVSLNDSISSHQNSKVMEKVRHLCEVMKQNGYAKQLDLNNITTGNLAMETLLSMTSRKAGEWFKEEIRSLGGLDYIIDAVHMCVELCGESNMALMHPVEEELDILRKVDRCLRVLENVSYTNFDNQKYLLEYKSSSLLKSCVSLLQVCRSSIRHCQVNAGPLEQPTNSAVRRRDGPGAVFFACILSLLKVLINLTNENRHGSQLAGTQEGLLECILLCILQTPQSVPQDERFDLLVLALGLLINLMEGCEDNRHRFVILKTLGSFDCHNNGFELSSMEALVEVFLNRCDLARQCEEHTNALLDGQGASKGQRSPGREEDGQREVASSHLSGSQGGSSHQSRAEEMEETLMKALQKAGKNMEHTMIAAYIALLLGCIIQTDEYADLVRVHLPDENFKCMVEVLRKFLNFINLTGSISTTGVKSIQRVLGILEAS